MARLSSGVPTLGAGRPSVDETDRTHASSYQLLRLTGGALSRLRRAYSADAERWAPPTEEDSQLTSIDIAWAAAQATFPLDGGKPVPEQRIGDDSWANPATSWGRTDARGRLDPKRELLDKAADICRVQYDRSIISRIDHADPLLRVTFKELADGPWRQRRIGAHIGTVTEEIVDRFAAQVRAASDDDSVLVYENDTPSRLLVEYARRRNIELRSFRQFQGLIDLSGYVADQSDRLRNDPRYAPRSYIPQAYLDVLNPDGVAKNDIVGDLLDVVADDNGRFVLLLGDFGLGKTFALRELARRIPEEHPHLTPLLIDLRNLDKLNTVDGHIAAHLANNKQDEVSLRLIRHMVESGRIVLIFDGFDELVARATYDRAAEHLEVLLGSAIDRAKIIVASRTQHFRSQGEVSTAMGAQVEALPSKRILSLTDLTDSKIRRFLRDRFGGQEEEVERRLAVLAAVPGLMALAKNARMLGFIAELDYERLRAISATNGAISPASLYKEILTAWLTYEEERTQAQPGTPVGMRFADLWAAVSALAVRMWESGERLVTYTFLRSLSETLTELAGGVLSQDEITYAVGSGSLLIRTEDDRFAFIHESVLEWLVAAKIAGDLESSELPDSPLLRTRVLTAAMVDFLCGLADLEKCRQWAVRTRQATFDGRPDEPRRANAGRVLARLSSSAGLDLRSILLKGEDLSDREWPQANLTDADLSGTQLSNVNLTGAVLRGARLRNAVLTDANLSDADLTGADLTGARIVRTNLAGANLRNAHLDKSRLIAVDLRRATVTGATWRRAALVSAEAATSLLTAARSGGAAVLPGDPVETMTPPATVSVLFGFDDGRLPRPVAFDSDGALLAVGSEDGTVTICDADTGRPLRTLAGHLWRTYAVMFSPTDPILATASVDGTVRLWNAVSGDCRFILDCETDWVWPMLFSNDGTMLATGSSDGVIRIWDVATGQQRWSLPGHTAPIWTATFDPSNEMLIAGDSTAQVRFWNMKTGKLSHTADSDGALTYWIRFDPRGRYVAGCSHDGIIRLWDPRTGRILHRLAGHQDRVYAFDFHPKEPFIISADNSGNVMRWDLPDGQSEPAGRVLGQHPGAVYRVTFSPFGTRFATGDSAGYVRLWNSETGEIVHELDRHFASVWPVMFRPDGERIATSSNDFTVRLWDTVTGARLTTLRGHGRRAEMVSFSPDGSHLAVINNDGRVRIWDPVTCTLLTDFTHHPDQLQSAIYSPSDPVLATASNDGRLYLWVDRGDEDCADYEEVRQLQLATSTVWATAFSPDGEFVASANDDGSVQLVFRLTGRTVAFLRPKGRAKSPRVRTLAFSPDGQMLATAGEDQLIHIWDVSQIADRDIEADISGDRPVRTFNGHTDWVITLAFSPDSHTLATGGKDGKLYLWNLRTGDHRLLPRDEEGQLWTVAFDPSGALLATGGDREHIDLWDVATGQRLRALRGHSRRIMSLTFNPEGTLLASSSADGTVRLWVVNGTDLAYGATLLGLADGWAAYTPTGAHKTGGNVSGQFWHITNMARFEPGELDEYLPELARLPHHTPLLAG